LGLSRCQTSSWYKLHETATYLAYEFAKVYRMLFAENTLAHLLLMVNYRLEQEEQARQKLQLEKVAVDGKLKKLEESAAIHEDTNNKVIVIKV